MHPEKRCKKKAPLARAGKSVSALWNHHAQCSLPGRHSLQWLKKHSDKLHTCFLTSFVTYEANLKEEKQKVDRQSIGLEWRNH
jgi:hypothetical protein